MNGVASATCASMSHELVELVLDGLSGNSLVFLQVLQEDTEALTCDGMAEDTSDVLAAGVFPSVAYARVGILSRNVNSGGRVLPSL